MTKQVQRRRGTATQHTSFTGAEGEISVNTTNKSVHVHDGVTAGGIEAARADMTNVSDGDLNSRLAGNTLSSLTITSADINGGTIDGTVIGGTTPAAGNFTTGSFTGNATFGDNDKAIFGAGSDLQIYHDGSNSYVQDAGSGNLYLRQNGTAVIIDDGTNNLAAFNSTSGESALYYGGSGKKLATTSTGVDISGTLTSDGLTVDGAALLSGQLRFNDTNYWIDNSGGSDISYRSGGTHQFYSGGFNQRLNIASNGDISFYEDTGTTPKMVWKASDERLGIGTSSPASPLHVSYSAAGYSNLVNFRNTDTGTGGYAVATFAQSAAGSATGIIGTGASAASNSAFQNKFAVGTQSNHAFTMVTNDTERMRIDSDGNVGIGTTSPSEKLHVSGSILIDEGDAAGNPRLYFDHDNFTGSTFIEVDRGSQAMEFWNQGSEAMRIDSSGNLLVGKTSDSFSTQGQVFAAGGYTDLTRAGTVLNLNRLTSDGDIVKFYKDGTTVGSIGTNGGDLTVGTGDVGLKFNDQYNTLMPFNVTTGSESDAVFDLGTGGNRFKDLYLSGGVYLGGTGAANKLDDYESGTWTPTAGSGSVTVNSATYTKIGDLVHLSARLDSFTDTTTNATLKVNGLPFTRATGTEAVGSLVGNNLGDAEITAVFTQTTYLEFYASSSTTSYNALKYNELGAPNQMYFSVTYRAA